MKLNKQQKTDILKLGIYVLAGTLLYKFYTKKPIQKPSTEPIKYEEAEYTEKPTKKKLDKNKDKKVDASELASEGIPPTDQNIIKANKLKGKKAEAVKSGTPETKKKTLSKEEFLERMRKGREKAKAKKEAQKEK